MTFVIYCASAEADGWIYLCFIDLKSAENQQILGIRCITVVHANVKVFANTKNILIQVPGMPINIFHMNELLLNLLIKQSLKSVLYLTSAAWCVFVCFPHNTKTHQRHATRLNQNRFLTFSCRWQSVCVCVRARVHTSACSWLLCVCVCVHGVYLWERQVRPPRRWQSDQTLCVTYKLLWPFFLSDSWLDGNKGHFTQLERVLKSAKLEEMASEEINSGKCLSSAGSKHTTLFPCVYALPISQKTSKTPWTFISTLCVRKKKKNRFHSIIQTVWLWKQNVALYDKFLLEKTDGSVSSVNLFATERPTHVAFTIIPLKPIKQSGHFVLEFPLVTPLTTNTFQFLIGA